MNEEAIKLSACACSCSWFRVECSMNDKVLSVKDIKNSDEGYCIGSEGTCMITWKAINYQGLSIYSSG